MNDIVRLPDGSAFFVAVIDPDAPDPPVVRWNPGNKVVQNHQTGTIYHRRTNVERRKRGLPTPWVPAMADKDVSQPDIQ